MPDQRPGRLPHGGPNARRLLVFGRVPRPGRVKTRLIPALGAGAAAALYERLLYDTLTTANGVSDAQVELWLAAEGDDWEEGLAIAERFGVAGYRQRGEDLGVRMHHALAAGSGVESSPALLIGSDCPDYNPAYLSEAFRVLCETDVVLGPAWDGGYVLIGVNRLDPHLFADIPWGSGVVLERTRLRLRELGWRWTELSPLRDIDRVSDLAHYPHLVEGLRVMTQQPRLLFVYNADSGLFNTLSDFGHKILSPDTYECQLCALTYGYFTERKPWRSFIEGLDADCVFLHRDEFRRRYPDNGDALPAVFRLVPATEGPAEGAVEDRQQGRAVVCLSADLLNSCKDLEALQGLILQRCLGESG